MVNQAGISLIAPKVEIPAAINLVASRREPGRTESDVGANNAGISAAPGVADAHAGTATPMVPNPRVTVSGQATVTMASVSPAAVSGYDVEQLCATAQWTTAAVRDVAGAAVGAAGQHGDLHSTGTPLFVTVVQPRVGHLRR
jgi:hypothetical protein